MSETERSHTMQDLRSGEERLSAGAKFIRLEGLPGTHIEGV